MKKLFKFLVGPVEIMCWFRWQGIFDLFTVGWVDGIDITICNLTIDICKRDEEF
jgi:hypothetical protein